jgi:DNA-binding IclR family transcriptional regulator
VARPILQRLSDEIGENICLGTLNKTDVIYMDEISANRYFAMGSRLGTVAPAYCSAIGKMLLSELSRPQFDQVLARTQLVAWTPRTYVDPEELWMDLRNIAVQGYAYECGEFEEGISGLAAAVRGPFGNAIAAFGVSGSSARLNSGKLRTLLPRLLAASERISGELGFHAQRRDAMTVSLQHMQ